MSTTVKILPLLSFRKRRIPTTTTGSSYPYNHYYAYCYESIRRRWLSSCTDTTAAMVLLHHTTGICNRINTTVSMNNGSYYRFYSKNHQWNHPFHFNTRVAQFTTIATSSTDTTIPITPSLTLEKLVDTGTSNDNGHDEQEDGETSSSTENLVTPVATSSSTSTSTSRASEFILNDEWIPPNRPLMGDVGQAHLYAHIEDDKELRQLLAEEENNHQKKTNSEVKGMMVDAEVVPPLASMDWLKTRRTMLTGQKMMKPDEAALYKQSMTDIELPIIEHMLYSEQELVQLIEAIGGQDVEVVLDHGDTKKGGRRRMGNDVMGIILVTGTNYIQMRNIANQIVRQLRRRKLQEVQVVGADLGPDGNMDDPNENWYVVDCGNYIIHIQDSKTRTAVNLAALWSGQDPIRKVDCTSDDAIDDYVARYPVPQNYTVGGSISATSTLLYDVNNWDATMKQFEKSRWARGNTNLLNAGSSNSNNNGNTRFRNKPIVPKRRRKTSGRKT